MRLLERSTPERRRVALVLGGARSGKSAFAERLAVTLGEPVLFLATATAIDSEMRDRIAAHQASRPDSWHSIECPTDVASAIGRSGAACGTLLLDCLTLLVSNHLVGASHDQLSDDVDPGPITQAVEREVAELLSVAEATGANLIVVSNEVGMGLVPPYPVGRAFRDLLGRANQQVAEAADDVYLMVAGIPMELKKSPLA
ncbi:MAG: bifunctional adenosylcobinamide kinase/adenosylcobinamide-phosphate guanylyltransferase [Chloroflexi bacterium]|nr:bifunctional adenosylcobinamide kinase/adenosylcobinamide-phosphate guanylyltransferase [Chloroflexota bacterium]